MAETIVKDAPVEDLTLEANKDTLQFTQGDLKSDFLISTRTTNLQFHPFKDLLKNITHKKRPFLVSNVNGFSSF